LSFFKKIISKTTGYWIYKQRYLPVGSDLFVDIYEKIKYPSVDVLFDVGANIGQTRSWFRSQESEAFIYCFEPVKTSFRKLKQSSSVDNNCILENFALGEEHGEKTIRLYNEDMSSLNTLRENGMNREADAIEECIKVETIDRYCRLHAISKVDLLKIDTEGYEIQVLKGAEQMMKTGAIPLIFCETGFQSFNQCNTFFPDLTSYLEKRDYYFFGLYQMDLHDWKRGNNLGNALYVHRSVFQ
jgi:FkbM family methyltransferase